jgi:hypothetical protein
MKDCVFEVQTRLGGERSLTNIMYSGYKIIAKNAEDAIRVAKKKMGAKEYAMTVKLIAELD